MDRLTGHPSVSRQLGPAFERPLSEVRARKRIVGTQPSADDQPISNCDVTPAMWTYDVSGKTVLRQWFGYRRRDRTKPIIGDRRPPSPLDAIQPAHWPAEYTEDLLDLLNLLGRLVALEPAQADLLGRVCAGPLLAADVLRAAGALPPAPG